MAFLFASVNFDDYGITPGRIKGGNVAVEGCFDMPSRIGKTYHEWGDEHGIEPYVESSDMMFGGRDISFIGTLFGSKSSIYNNLDSFNTATKAVTGLQVFSTPYGNFNTYIKNTEAVFYPGACEMEVLFREPVVTLTGGTLPATGSSAYSIDSIPCVSFGLYVSMYEKMKSLPKMKSMEFTKYGAEGYQITKRTNHELQVTGFISATSISNYQSKIKALYLLFMSPGQRAINFNNEITENCFADEGFTVGHVLVTSTEVISQFKMNLKVI